ncbi:MAG: SMC-Scp complex subunit ScpB [Candidatus Diapherotrites archaeon]|nr:SMC-Scp complex subunit ScpB [Candidatus Diapherotrites archaeon]
MELTKEEKKKAISVALFMNPEPISLAKIAELLGMDESEVKELTKELVAEFNSLPLGFYIKEFDNSLQMKVRPEFEYIAREFATEAALPKGALKTLALIALKQPIKQSLVIKYRNNKAYDHIKLLEQEGFISKERIGRTFLLRTTKKFIQYFGESIPSADNKDKTNSSSV